jgi:hypothetical protein
MQHLDPDCEHAWVRGGRALDGADVVVRHADESARVRREALACLVASGGRERGERASVPGTLHHDRLRLRLAVFVTVHPHQLQRRFVRLGAGVPEEDLLHARERADAIGEQLLLANAVDVRCVNQLADLVGQRRDEARMRMPEAVDRDARERVEVLAALFVVQARALAVRE